MVIIITAGKASDFFYIRFVLIHYDSLFLTFVVKLFL